MGRTYPGNGVGRSGVWHRTSINSGTSGYVSIMYRRGRGVGVGRTYPGSGVGRSGVWHRTSTNSGTSGSVSIDPLWCREGGGVWGWRERTQEVG